MDIEVSKSLPAKLQGCPVKTDDGESITIGQLVRGQAALLLFVRHFGCIGCSENVGLLSVRFDELDKLGVRICIIGCGPHIFIQGFKERQNLLYSPAEIYSDDTLASHQAAGLMYSIWGGFRPKALYEMGRAFVNGHVAGDNEGDIKQQAGAVFVDSESKVRLYHRNKSLGDHVSGSKIVDIAMATWLANNPGVM